MERNNSLNSDPLLSKSTKNKELFIPIKKEIYHFPYKKQSIKQLALKSNYLLLLITLGY